MKKTDQQIQCYLSANSFRTQTDWEMIAAFCKDKAEISQNIEIDPENGITTSDFRTWYDTGFGAGDIVWADGKLGIIGKIDFKGATIVANLSDDTILIPTPQTRYTGLKMASNEEINKFRRAMLKNKLQFSFKTCSLIPKHIPETNERVLFYDCNSNIKGVGVVRDVDLTTAEVELYCYFIYQTKQCGYNMHEKGICNLNDFVFESIDNNSQNNSGMNHISCQRRLNRELERYGKIWNQSRHRVEPLDMRVAEGCRYWYIDDKLTLKQDTEKGYQISRNRALAGNYFSDVGMGIEALGRINETIRDYLASPESNPKRD